MDRGIVVGGVLIGASFLLAVMLNRSAEKPVPAPTVVEQPCERHSPARSAPPHEQASAEDGLWPADSLDGQRARTERDCAPTL
jgi:hypothetical protein